jgi:CRP-like cAMP-binding protein
MIEQLQSWFFKNPMIRKLGATVALTADEKDAILELPLVVRDFKADQDMAVIGELQSQCCVLLEGWACRYKMVPGGARQIMSFHLAGDLIDVQSLLLPTMDHSIAAMTPVKVALVQHRDMRDLLRLQHGIASAVWRDSLIDAAIFREWMVGIGRRSAHERVAHLLCEMATKARAVGLADNDSYPWPVTQIELADALGLSSVHVNRVLGDLKKWRLVSFTRTAFVAEGFQAGPVLGQFDPHYLHLDTRRAA